MRNVIFSEASLKRIAAIRRHHITYEETEQYEIKLIESIRHRLSFIAPKEEYYRGPWANTWRVIVMGFKVNLVMDSEENVVRVRGIKSPEME